MSSINTRHLFFLLLGIAVVLLVVGVGSYFTNTGPWKLIVGSGIVIGIIAGIARTGDFILDDSNEEDDDSFDKQSVEQNDTQESGAVEVGGDNYGDISAGSVSPEDSKDTSELEKRLKEAKIEERKAKAEYYRNASQREQKQIDALEKLTETLPDREDEEDTLDESLDKGEQ